MNHGQLHREQIGPAHANRSVLDHLVAEFGRADRVEWSRRIAAGELTLGDHLAASEERLKTGDWLTWHRPPWEEPIVPLTFEVLLEDEDLLAVAKPSALPTLPSGDFVEHTLLALVRRRDPSADPMHRLGRGTSGIVVFARTELARRRLAQAFRERLLEKRYRALISGAPTDDAFTVTHPIGLVPHPLLGEVFAASPTGKPSTSHAAVVERRGGDTLVDVRIETGRPHQIRIHMAAVGHPLTGDPLYLPGGGARPDAVPGDLGYSLHAAELGFEHPRTGKRVAILCRPPDVLLSTREG